VARRWNLCSLNVSNVAKDLISLLRGAARLGGICSQVEQACAVSTERASERITLSQDVRRAIDQDAETGHCFLSDRHLTISNSRPHSNKPIEFTSSNLVKDVGVNYEGIGGGVPPIYFQEYTHGIILPMVNVCVRIPLLRNGDCYPSAL